MMFELLFGGVFFTVGVIAFLTMTIVGFTTGPLWLVLMALLFGGVFGGIGAGFLIYCWKEFQKNRKTNLYGTEYIGRIVSHGDTSTYINGVPLLKVGIAVFDGKTCNLFWENTNTTDESKYPIGYNVRVKIFEGDLNMVPNTVGIPNQDMYLEDGISMVNLDEVYEEFAFVLQETDGKMNKDYVLGSYAQMQREKQERDERMRAMMNLPQKKEEEGDTIVINGVTYKKVSEAPAEDWMKNGI